MCGLNRMVPTLVGLDIALEASQKTVQLEPKPFEFLMDMHDHNVVTWDMVKQVRDHGISNAWFWRNILISNVWFCGNVICQLCCTITDHAKLARNTWTGMSCLAVSLEKYVCCVLRVQIELCSTAARESNILVHAVRFRGYSVWTLHWEIQSWD